MGTIELIPGEDANHCGDLWGCVKSKISSFCMELLFVVVVGEDANNGKWCPWMFKYAWKPMHCRCWRPRQQPRRSAIVGGIDGIFTFDTTPTYPSCYGKISHSKQTQLRRFMPLMQIKIKAR